MKIKFCFTLMAFLTANSMMNHAAYGAVSGGQGANSTSLINQVNTVDPAWFRTPEPKGLGSRKITVTSGQSLQDAFNKAQPGDVVEIGPGEYRATNGLVLLNSGTSEQWIAVRAAPGAAPKIDLNNTGSFTISASNVLVEGLEIVNGKGDNLHISPWQRSIRNIIVRAMKIHSLKTGSGAAIKINRNNPIGASVEAVYIENSDLQQPINNAVVDGVGVRTAVVRNCWIHNPPRGNSGVFFKGGSSLILLEGNLVSGIRGNSAVMLGGNSGGQYFSPDVPNQEGVDQFARNNIIADYDDSAIEVRGVQRGYIYNNTIVGDSLFAVFRLQFGNNASGGKSPNQEIVITDNLVINTAPAPILYAWNDGNIGSFKVGPQVWAGLFHQYERNGLPTFPQSFDVRLTRYEANKVLRNPNDDGLNGLADSVARYTVTPGSPALGRSSGVMKTPYDLLGKARSTTASTIGALEEPQ
jgi:hypothetical protein